MCNKKEKERISYHKGQRILYKGKEAVVLEAEPVITVQVIDKNQIICGNIMDDIKPFESKL